MRFNLRGNSQFRIRGSLRRLFIVFALAVKACILKLWFYLLDIEWIFLLNPAGRK